MSPVFDLRKKVEAYVFGFLFVVAILYGMWRAYPLVAGPHVTIRSPKEGSVVASTSFMLSGQVSRVKNIEIQGRPVPIDKDGNFNEILVANAPYTLIVIKATDFYDKTIIKSFKVTPDK